MANEMQRFQDSIDACTWAREWVEAQALADVTEDARPGSRRISTFSFREEDGGLIAYFRDDRPVAIAAILRDTWNYSVAVQIYTSSQDQGEKK